MNASADSLSSLLVVCSEEESHGYGGDDGQADDRVAGAVHLGDSEALAKVPALIWKNK